MKMNKCNHYRSSFLTPFIDKVPYDITNKHIACYLLNMQVIKMLIKKKFNKISKQ